MWRWTTRVVGCVVVTLGLWAFWLEPASLSVVEHELNLEWPGKRPLRVAVLTDLHVGYPFNGMAKLHSTVDRIGSALELAANDFHRCGDCLGASTGQHVTAPLVTHFTHRPEDLSEFRPSDRALRALRPLQTNMVLVLNVLVGSSISDRIQPQGSDMHRRGVRVVGCGRSGVSIEARRRVWSHPAPRR